ncbi:MAG: DUF1566 domain-containing protein [Phenylobacterium sp.]|nr:DUF1566 domain-containing protein [Burkholderiales bacterium]MCA6254556.1 DUF1566 domain-containing protein [Phenylobacterium sp.]
MSKNILQAINAEIEAHKKWIVQHARCLDALKAARAALTETSSAKLQAPLKLGEKMPDGTIYVGVSPDSGNALFAMPHDLPNRLSWPEAQKSASEQNFGGHVDWRLPTRNEVELLRQANAWSGSSYWTSTEYNRHDAWYFNCGAGHCGLGLKGNDHRARCIRG